MKTGLRLLWQSIFLNSAVISSNRYRREVPQPRQRQEFHIPVADLDAALAFYRDRLGHELIWRDDSAAGLRLPDSDAELVLHTDDRLMETDFLVASVPAAISRFVEAGGKVIAGPFEIRIGLCAMIEDPWQNRLVILDSSKGSLRTDAEGNVIERGGT